MKFVVLFGPKHSGKTAVGRELALLCSYGFCDLDGYIAERCGKSVRTLYTQGTEIFRKEETAALSDLLEPEMPHLQAPLVIASGGGIIDNPDVLALLKKKQSVVTVYLDVSVQTAWERISRAGDLPPFLAGDNPRETHRLLHERRADAYRQYALFTVKAEDKNPAEIAREITELLSHRSSIGP